MTWLIAGGIVVALVVVAGVIIIRAIARYGEGEL